MTTWPVTSRARDSLLVLAVAMALSGCSESGEAEPIPTVAASPTTATPTPTPSPSPTETVSDEQAAAERALDRYLQVSATLAASSTANPDMYDAVSYGLGNAASRDYLAQSREQGLLATGPTKVLSRKITKNDLELDPPTLVIEQCLDVSKRVITKNGEPFDGPRTDRTATTFGVSFWKNKWQVSFLKLQGPNEC